MKSDFEIALYDLCAKVEDFRLTSRDIIIPERKRRERLKQYAEYLQKAATNFLKAVSDND